MKQAIYAVYGANGFGREVMPSAREQLSKESRKNDLLVFIDDYLDIEIVNGHHVYTYQEYLSLNADNRFIALAISDSTARERLATSIYRNSVKPWHIIASNTVVMDHVEMAEGAILCPFVTLTSNIKIGKFFHANIYSYVAHDCQIGDFVTFAPGVKCNGNVIIEDHVYIGAGAAIKQGKPNQPLVIGKHAVVGMGAVVTKNVLPGTTVVGNPAKIMS